MNSSQRITSDRPIYHDYHATTAVDPPLEDFY
jgi:hypothetical protein